ncbi:MAG: magnesium/cobalt transporter CorA [Phycisphaerae bacterium]
MDAKNSANGYSNGESFPAVNIIQHGEKPPEPARITLIDYNEQQFQERQITEIEDCLQLRTEPTVTWINVDGIEDINTVLKLGKVFGLHDLVIEDIVTAWQRPKFEDYEEYIFVVFKMLTYNERTKSLDTENVSIVLGDNFVLSFQEKVGDVFEQIRNRIRASKGRIRKMGCDYLVYSLIDATVDHYFDIMEKIGERIEVLEDHVVTEPGSETLQEIHDLKTDMLFLRKSVWPLREVINNLQKTESDLIKNGTTLYLRDVYDHTIQIIDTIESYRDTVSSMLDVYLSSVNNRMNAIMKVLTIIATIFMPLSFFTGVYGMNFAHFPELHAKWAYPFGFWAIVIVVVSSMLFYFKKKDWL